MNFHPFDESGDPNPLESFGGITRLFPLPNVVLFPGVLLPLHIFEPRYRQMVADAMDSDRLITVVLLKPGYEEHYEASPPIYDVGCLGQVFHHEPLPDGKSNLILRGVSRVRIDSEKPTSQLYRTARVTVLKDCYPDGGPEAVSDSVERVLGTMTQILKLVGRGSDAEKLAAAGEVPGGRVCDLACHCLGLDIGVKQSLLAELDVIRRADTLLAWMQALLKTIERRIKSAGEPPEFSPN